MARSPRRTLSCSCAQSPAANCRDLFRGKRNGGAIVFARPHPPLGKHLVLRDPLERLLEYFFRIGLEHDPLTRPPSARIHHGMETIREFVLVIVRIALR